MKRLLLWLPWLSGPLWAGVVLNEIAYHPPAERDDLQFVELHNPDAAAVDLSGWQFTAGIEWVFPAGTKIAPGGFLVVARDPAALATEYKGVSALGPFHGVLKHGGEKLTLADATKKAVDSVKYGDRAPWPASPDGSGSTLERVSSAGRGDDPANWCASALPEREKPAGTPGKKNTHSQTASPATVANLAALPWRANAPVTVSVRVEDLGGVDSVTVGWTVIKPGEPASAEQQTAAKRLDGTAAAGRYEAALPPLPPGQFLRYRVTARSTSGATRVFPDPEDLRPTQTLAAWTNLTPATIDQFFLYQLGPAEAPENGRFNFFSRRNRTPPADPTRGANLLVVVPTNGPAEIYDHIRLSPRSGGWKIRFTPDAPWHGVRTANVIFENKSRWLLSEFLGYELFRRASVPAPLAGFVRLTLDGQSLGYHLWVEQPNRSFLQRHQRAPEGELFKTIWMGNSLEEHHEKKTGLRTGHAALQETVAQLEKLKGAEAWAYIQEHFDVTETINFYAVNLLIQNWDGYFNNLYLHQAPAKQQKWQTYPWDLDKTWGEYDGASTRYDWYTMPVTYGMNGDHEPSDWKGARMNLPWGSTPWWRPGGIFSGPLLANADYRKRYLARVRELLATEFIEEKFGPVIDALGQRLQPEVRLRGEIRGNDPAATERRFKSDLASFHRQLEQRAEFLRGELK